MASFRLTSKRRHVTYKHHVGKGELEQFLRGLHGLSEFYCAHESADDENPYEHTHCVFELRGKHDTRNARFYDLPADFPSLPVAELVHPNIQPVNDETHWINAVRYMGKEDPANNLLRSYGDLENARRNNRAGRPPEDPVDITGIWACDTLQEAFSKFVKKASDVGGVERLWKARPKTRPKLEMELRAWQRDVWEIISEPRREEARDLLWIYEEIGNTGKSRFCRWAVLQDPTMYLSVPSANAERDLNCAVAKHLDQHPGKLRAILFDLPRQCQSAASIYGSLENLLNGNLFQAKYDSECVLFNYVHVVVFANWLPRTHSTTLSDDRWDIRYVNPDFTLSRVSLANARIMWAEQQSNLVDVYEQTATRRPYQPMNAFEVMMPPSKRVIVRRDSNESD